MRTRDDYVKGRLEKARQALKDADIMIKSNSFEAAVNRIYYAVFYSASALVYTKKLHPKTHTGMKILFNREFVFPGLIKHEYERFYSAIFEKRMEADYGEKFEISSNNINEYYKEAENFVSLIQEILNNIPEK